MPGIKRSREGGVAIGLGFNNGVSGPLFSFGYLDDQFQILINILGEVYQLVLGFLILLSVQSFTCCYSDT